jgi:phosphoribosylaminoimidazole-succinocarboxamide synthase
MSHPERTHPLHESTALQVPATTDPRRVWNHFKDSATAFDGTMNVGISEMREDSSRIRGQQLSA